MSPVVTKFGKSIYFMAYKAYYTIFSWSLFINSCYRQSEPFPLCVIHFPYQPVIRLSECIRYLPTPRHALLSTNVIASFSGIVARSAAVYFRLIVWYLLRLSLVLYFLLLHSTWYSIYIRYRYSVYVSNLWIWIALQILVPNTILST